jgi:hypothetical protein
MVSTVVFLLVRRLLGVAVLVAGPTRRTSRSPSCGIS